MNYESSEIDYNVINSQPGPVEQDVHLQNDALMPSSFNSNIGTNNINNSNNNNLNNIANKRYPSNSTKQLNQPMSVDEGDKEGSKEAASPAAVLTIDEIRVLAEDPHWANRLDNMTLINLMHLK